MNNQLAPIDLRLVTPLLNNLYWVHKDIVAAIANAIPQRNDTEAIWLATQLRREALEVPLYKGRLDAIGFIPTEAIRINDSKQRYRELRITKSPIVLAVGMNVVAQGTLGVIEHEYLHRYFGEFLSFFPEVISGMKEDLDVAIGYLSEQPTSDVLAEFQRLWIHLHLVTIPELTPLLEPIIARGIFPKTLVQESIERFLKIADQLGISKDAFSPKLLS